MSSTFFGFNIARSGLFASQRALYVTGHNIANVNTPGYTRQRLDMSQSKPLNLPNGEGMLGTGVDTTHINQIRDQFLDYKFREENQALGEWGQRTSVLENIEAIMNEPSETGISSVIDDYFEAIQQLSTKPEDLTVRALVRERGIALANTINHMGNQLDKLQTDLDFNVQTVVSQVNTYGKRIADLNDQIFRAEIDGTRANDLKDQRNLAIDQLSELVDIQTIENEEGKVNILIGGTALVSHNRVTEMKLDLRGNTEKVNPDIDVNNLHDVKWADGSKVILKGGKLKGLVDARDNVSGSEKGVPYYISKLDEFAKTFAEKVNEIHSKGFGLNGDTGMDFFGTTDTNGGMSATSICISKDIEDTKDGLNNIAASRTYADLAGDGGNALLLNALKDDAEMFAWGRPGDFMNSLVSNLGVDSQQAINVSKNQIILTGQMQNKRQSVSGVSMDEEMSNMVKFQHAYNANARMITTVDEMIDTIINRMGLVGR
ncbi:flagellar hook-associated protein FlgK [Lutibacter sp. B2]|nr:flagellar hook-associated protein FlgK [Lutibacter sp. B2]